jgi:DNA primase
VEQNKDNQYVIKALEYCKLRRLFTCVNKPRNLYVSLNDPIHEGRLIIPFIDADGDVVSYQGRLLKYKPDAAKYLSKFGVKGLFGEHNISSDCPYVFVFEGPIDAMFVQNGVAVGGVQVTDYQTSKLALLALSHKIIYVYDNDDHNKEVQCIIRKTIDNGEHVFIWPKEFKQFKDVNEICCKLNMDQISTQFFASNAFHDVEALVRL